MNTTPITLPGLAAILAAAAERAEDIVHVRALDPDAADLLEAVSAEIGV